jgi:3-hydroxyacyl-CoA dehydrogenase
MKQVAVLGAGVMGSQIAAHFANAGMKVYLLDIASEGKNKNEIVEKSFHKAQKQKPPIFFTDKTHRRITLGNFDEHLHYLNNVDWVIEAVVENLKVKQQLFAKIADIVPNHAIISSNTSGLPLAQIAQDLPLSVQKRFLGTHFFNPPRYLKLLELIPLPTTDDQVIKKIHSFGRLHLGKGVVVAKDTPGFIANRIGMYATMLTLDTWLKQDYTIEEIDTITGTLIGHPKSATFRTIDLVGLDVLAYVSDHLYHNLKDDRQRHIFQVPEILTKLVKMGALGAKVGHGFYKKEKGQILSLNLDTLTYETAPPLNLENLDKISKIKNIQERLIKLYQDQGRCGQLFRYLTLHILNYCATCIPEITDNPADLDRAMAWGFGWEIKPFELWDILGFNLVIEDMKKEGLTIPYWIEKLNSRHVDNLYHHYLETGETTIQESCLSESCVTSGIVHYPWGSILLAKPYDEISLAAIQDNPHYILWQNDESALFDLGNGVILFQMRSKGNTLSKAVVEGLLTSLDLLVEKPWQGMVIGNDDKNFCAGANLLEMATLAQGGKFPEIALFLDEVQTLMKRIRYSPKPVVSAVQGLALGGGCELMMATSHVVASAESYIGLVELGVGLIPGAGGIMSMASWASQQALKVDESLLDTYIIKVFKTVGMATVSESAEEAINLGFLPCNTHVVINSDRKLYVAKQLIAYLSQAGYLPPSEREILVAGESGRAMLEMMAYNMQQGGWISEYDQFLANKLAYVLTGGEITAPSYVSEDYLFNLEKTVFLPLLQEAKTQERVTYMLQHKKPLKN